MCFPQYDLCNMIRLCNYLNPLSVKITVHVILHKIIFETRSYFATMSTQNGMKSQFICYFPQYNLCSTTLLCNHVNPKSIKSTVHVIFSNIIFATRTCFATMSTLWASWLIFLCKIVHFFFSNFGIPPLQKIFTLPHGNFYSNT